MEEINYAHNDTSAGEKNSGTKCFVKLKIEKNLQKVRESAFQRRIPVADDETLNFLICTINAVKPKNILELGTAIGVSGVAMLKASSARLTTVEKHLEFYEEAKLNFKAFGVSDRVNAIYGDAGEVIEMIDGGFDFIFLDSAKSQYVKYLPRLKQLLNEGGVLLADDVLLFGWVNSEEQTPKKRKALVKHITDYINAVTEDPEFVTSVLNVGDGVALSVKISNQSQN